MATHLITGAGSGIGEVTAQKLADRGDELVLVARSPERATELGERFPGSRVLVADLGRPMELDRTLDATDLPGRLDSILHIAGVVDLGTVGELSAQSWRRSLDVNLIAPAVLTRIFLPALRAARGHVVFVNSGSGLHAHPQWSSYAASKHGLRALAESLRGEESGHGVRVSTIYPGRVATAMQQKVHVHEGKDYDPDDWITPDSVATTILAALDLPRDAEITDLSVRPGPR